METKKLVVELSQNIKQQKLTHKNNKHIPITLGVEERDISANKQIKIYAIYKLLQENQNLTKQQLIGILKRRPLLFSYYRVLLKKYPNFIYSIKSTGPSYYVLKEAQNKQYGILP